MISLKNWQDCKTQLKISTKLPQYDIKKIKKNGKKQPKWIHIGAGNLYRSFHCEIADDLCDAGLLDRGIVVANMRSPFAIEKIYRPFNNDILMVKMCSDGKLKKRILSATADSLFASPNYQEDWTKLKQYFQSKDLQLVTYTITEKGYTLYDGDNNLSTDAIYDINNGPQDCKTAIGLTSSLLLERYNAGKHPVAMVSTDNFSRNGKKFRDAVITIAKNWRNNGFAEQGFVDYVSDENIVSFPWSMIDRITPNPSKEVAETLKKEGWGDLDIVYTPGGTGFSCFANTEETSYLVLEDTFPNGRPAFEKVGVIMCDRQTAELADTMKVTACLNPLHTSMAIFGCLLGYTRIWQETEDKDIVALIRHLGFDEDLPVVKDPKVLNPQKFINELINVRLPNKSLPDAPQRIACDTSQKIPIRYGHTITAYVNNDNFEVADLKYIPLTIAAWLRYLIGVDDEGKAFEVSSDPMLETLRAKLEPLELGCVDAELVHKCVEPILANKKIFTQNLYEIGMAEKVEDFLLKMLKNKGAVRQTLSENV